jgi:DNA-binding CsgD family transcriptional regulator
MMPSDDRLPFGPSDGVVLEKAYAATRVLRDLVPCAAFALTAWNPISGADRHQVLVSDGYAGEILDHLNDDYVRDNPAFRLLRSRVPSALRWRDLAQSWGIDFAGTVAAEQFLRPAGFNEGTTACLRLPNGRYTGSLHVSWESPSDATDDRREMIERLRPVLAVACDLLEGPQTVAQTVASEAFAVVVSGRGVVADLSGREPGPHLCDGGELRAFLLHRWKQREAMKRFLWIDGTGGWHRVELITCRGDVTLLAEQRTPPPYALTPRELEVLHLVASGASNPEIGRKLFVSARTVSTHVEHILAKLQCVSRAQLAVRVGVEGLLCASLL